MLGAAYVGLLLGVAIFVFRKGGADEKVAVATLIFGSAATLACYALSRRNFVDPVPLLFVTEAAVLAILLILAYRSSRFWPLTIAALQIASFLALLTPLTNENLVSYALGVAQGLWAYPQMLILVLAAIRYSNRKKLMMSKPFES